MSDQTVVLNPRSKALLLNLLDLAEPVLSAEAFGLQPPDAIGPLVAAGLLKPDGHELAAASRADHDDIPVVLSWFPERRGYGYFSPTGGWITVCNEQITRHRLDVPALLKMLLARAGETKRPVPTEILQGLVWDLTDVRLPHRTPRVLVWFARRLSDPRIWRSLRETALARPPGSRRLILTSTPRERLTSDPITNHTLVSIHDLMDAATFSVDADTLSALLDGHAPNVKNDVLVIIGDGREVRLRGQVFKFPKGMEQRRIITFLHQRYLRGENRVSNDEIVAELGLRANARIRDYFKKNKAWNRLLTESGGTCGFVLDSAAGTSAN